MEVNSYKLIEMCIENGIDRGYTKAFKHTDTPSEEEIKDTIEHYIMLEICEYFNFKSVDE